MIEDSEIIRGFECRGEWWLPNDSKHKFSGSVKFSAETGGLLTLLGKKNRRWNISQLLKFKITIFGKTEIGNLTLFNCALKSTSASNDSLSSAVFGFNDGIIGKHVTEKENFLISDLSINYSYLSAWCESFGIYPLKTTVLFKDGKSESFYNSPLTFLLSEDKNYIVSLITESKKSFYITDKGKQIKIEENPYINISLKNNNNFFEYQIYIKLIQYFLSFALSKQVFPLVIKGKTMDNKTIKFFFPLPSTPFIETLLIPNFTLDDIKQAISECIKIWIDKKEKLEPSYELYFNSLNDSFSPGLRFLYLLEAIENICRTFQNSKFIEDTKYKENNGIYDKLARFIEAIPADKEFKEHLKKTLERANEYPLRKKLKIIFNNDLYLNIVNSNKTIIEKKNIRKFINSIINTRNYYTHHDEKVRKKILEGEELNQTIKALKALTEILLMNEISLNPQKIKTHPSVVWMKYQ